MAEDEENADEVGELHLLLHLPFRFENACAIRC
jgi:hypothetical protein